MPELESIQDSLLTNPDEALIQAELLANEKWSFFSSVLETIYIKKSRIRWLKEGDANTRFFHMAVLAHQAGNAITHLRNAGGNHIDNMVQVKDMICSSSLIILGLTWMSPFYQWIKSGKSTHTAVLIQLLKR